MVLVKSVKLIIQGWLYVTFDNGEQKIVCIKPYINGVLEKLNDPEFFKQVFVDPELETISWPGELDLDPDNLYREGFNIDDIKNWLLSFLMKIQQERIYTIQMTTEREPSLLKVRGSFTILKCFKDFFYCVNKT